MVIKLIFSLLFSFTFAQPTEITKLGQRDPACKQNPDETFLTIPEVFTPQSQSLFEENKLNRVIVAGDFCYRVGTEINLKLEKGDIQELGKAFVNKVEIYEASEIQQNPNFVKNPPLHWSEYLASNKDQKIHVIHFQIMEKLANTFMNTQYDRLQTCFVSYADWTTHPLNKEKWQEELEAIKNGSRKAEIWNSSINCYKVGIYADIEVEGRSEKLGRIVPTALYLTHYSQISEEQAQILGENLTALKERMAKNKDKYGGYTTMVVFDYIPPEVE